MVDGLIENVPVRLLLDTGSSVTIVKEEIFLKATSTSPAKQDLNLSVPLVYTAGGEQLQIHGRA